jgi:hypothetical protein
MVFLKTLKYIKYIRVRLRPEVQRAPLKSLNIKCLFGAFFVLYPTKYPSIYKIDEYLSLLCFVRILFDEGINH